MHLDIDSRRTEAEMSRRVFDILASSVGVIIVVVLLVAGGLLTWGHSYVNSTVHDQLAMQQIYFPPAAAFAHPNGTEITKAMTPTVSQYAGQELLTGPQAEAYANHFIAAHLSQMPYKGVYSKVSAASMANPKNTQLQTLKQTSFQGTTLRGMLLEAYGFWKIGEVMMWGAIACFILAAITAALAGLGFWHAQRTREEERLLAPKAVPAAS
jgi:hypothetical protein